MRVTLDSIRHQTIRPLELIVIDDASTDETWRLLQWYRARYDQNQFYVNISRNKERKGAAYCRNIGNRRAEADHIFVTDAGDENHKARTKLTLKAFRNNTQIGIFHSAVVQVNVKGGMVDFQFPRNLTSAQGEKPCISHPTLAYKRGITHHHKYRETNPDTDQYEAFLIEAVRCGHKFGVIPQILVKKLEMPEYNKSRNMLSARRTKRKIYEEFGLTLPAFLSDEALQYA